MGSYPFDFLRTVLASQGEPMIYPDLRSAFIGTLQSRGVRGLYAGLAPTLIEIVPYAGIQFGSYDTFKQLAKFLCQMDPRVRLLGAADYDVKYLDEALQQRAVIC
ncbi:hypothetical protein L7F22_029656 [Adiantum nelumboides]|nr:hypothetical protein [Adiantum nelumboides]